MSTVLQEPQVTQDLSPDEQLDYEIANYQRPQIHAGAIVQWFRQGDSTALGYRAFVTKVGDRALEVQVVNLDAHVYGQVQNSVRHKDDPELRRRKALARNHGTWDYTPEHKQIAALEVAAVTVQETRLACQMIAERLSALANRVSKLETEWSAEPVKKKNN